MILYKVLRDMTGVGFVESVGLIGAFFSFVHFALTTEQLVCCRGAWLFHRLSEHGYLLPERQVLKD
jgi:hypothetical protein